MPSVIELLRSVADPEPVLAELQAQGFDLDDIQRGAWWACARPEQIPADVPYWFYIAGRGSGKTRSGANWAIDRAILGERVALVAGTRKDLLTFCVGGESGIVREAERRKVPLRYSRTADQIRVGDGIIELFSASAPERLRGPQFHAAWCDEVGAWNHLTARATWDNLTFGMRLGNKPRYVITSTPRNTPLVKHLLALPGVVTVRSSSYANRANLPASVLAAWEATYGNTRLGRQELYGEMMLDTPGALWQPEWIFTQRAACPSERGRVVVAIDPAATASEKSDESGIICAALAKGDVYVLADASARLKPADAARVAWQLAEKYGADTVIYESNQGGEWVRSVLNETRPPGCSATVKDVSATESKLRRAQPVALAYERGQVHHPLEPLSQLETQLLEWVPTDKKSPDRLDALVWAVDTLLPTHGAGAAWISI